MGKKAKEKRALRECLGGCVDKRTGRPKKFLTTKYLRLCMGCRRKVATFGE